MFDLVEGFYILFNFTIESPRLSFAGYAKIIRTNGGAGYLLFTFFGGNHIQEIIVASVLASGRLVAFYALTW